MPKTKEIAYVFVDSAPDVLKPGTMYISTKYRAIVHACLCGCAEKVLLNLDPDSWSLTFDGRSIFTTSETGRFEGELVSRTFTGPYLVNADCTGFLDFSSNLSNPPHEAHGDFVIVDEGKGFFVLDNEDGWAAGGVARKL